MLSDTIAAIATAVGEGGIAVVRVSGPEAVTEVEALFRSKTPLSKAPTHTVHYGHIIDPQSQEKVEEVLVTVMRAPRSFTTEDVVEISTHGGVVAVKRVMDLLLLQNIRLAEPGEFTKRAFLNGRIDLSQAEGVIDLIRSKSDKAFSMALKQVDGQLSQNIRRLRHVLVETLAHIEVNIDYPEHDVESFTSELIKDKSSQVMAEIDRLLHTAEQGKILREGLTTAIVGRPNVGKSSLLNTLAQGERAIVTDIPGTTRDVIEEYVTINNIPLKLLDTAGIRETMDVVERIGVERSRTAVSEADLLLIVMNANEPLHEDEMALMEQIRGRQAIVIMNKMDLPAQIDRDLLLRYVPEELIVPMSVKENEGADRLEQAISNLFFSGKLESADMTYVSNVRHIALLKKARQSLVDAYEAADQFVPIDMIQIDVRLAWEHLGEIVGDTAHDALIDQIFSQFCLGK
ncbi:MULTISPECIES: tRNA uridine-5-carboxymethylaminomethyl(34) synthesis GTPase MnmE [Paenibacillus]|uniref:tRNA uridine-5-carboxymethylaminomethyl(34) synthesis GTPase MnmE n=1 Tax=Paenibacillus TaxID=44249 RepID=UPI0002D45F54|nr:MULTISPECIES: tRNA uridine-5-carboxymethylaminomethyl(34) synthesis GTPase MnmE [Paenibacillus]KJK29856.1 tRNA modification GTPase [Paenibacillus polymyxa]KKD55878.1 tRNA modification GTPase [Paenibacillus sp. ICGEB2008]MBY7737891.1 tRNA uridine-5-carboxymethylaminomethyl(34) synthesis GTPase MnmE [Paenibacillus polymyxa]MDU8673825.1 tRNA uridine-5-carboxymethylaminomethyl(34) synthesis GTPase MnmE [Paenibacillus polymyxa]MDU8698732.1 tRNA uridine-5-carboxymethylaminomethyl(34) synthesis GT